MTTKTLDPKATMNVTSTDGSTIAYDLSGTGPLVVLVGQALSDRKDHRRLAALLAEHYTVINYDRRGRGLSTEASPWSTQREVEDIGALVDAHGGIGSIFGASAGAVLSLEAAHSLPDKVEKVIAFEAPVIVDDGRPPIPREFPRHLGQLVREGRRSQAVSEFMRQALGAPAAMTIGMRLMFPIWRQMTAMAQTTEYDLELCMGLQDGRAIPDDRWKNICAPSLVLVGEKSDPWAHTSAAAVAAKIGGRVETIAKAHHGTPTMQPKVVLPHLQGFLQAG